MQRCFMAARSRAPSAVVCMQVLLPVAAILTILPLLRCGRASTCGIWLRRRKRCGGSSVEQHDEKEATGPALELLLLWQPQLAVWCHCRLCLLQLSQYVCRRQQRRLLWEQFHDLHLRTTDLPAQPLCPWETALYWMDSGKWVSRLRSPLRLQLLLPTVWPWPQRPQVLPCRPRWQAQRSLPPHLQSRPRPRRRALQLQQPWVPRSRRQGRPRAGPPSARQGDPHPHPHPHPRQLPCPSLLPCQRVLAADQRPCGTALSRVPVH